MFALENFVLNAATQYCASVVDVHNTLHALGLKSDEEAEEFNKKHIMRLANMYTRRGYDITDLSSKK